MSKPALVPYLFFNGRCEEALSFYEKALGAKTVFKTVFDDAPQPMPKGSIPDDWGRKVMHATMAVGESIVLVSDGHKKGAEFTGFSLSLDYSDEAVAKKAFAALADGGKVVMPLTKTFWSPLFGMLTDRFGVGWMVSLAHGENSGG